MLKYWNGSKWWRQVTLGLAAFLLLGPSLVLTGATAETALPAPPPAELTPGVRTILSTDRTVTLQPIHYPSGAPALLTAVEIVLQPGQQTGWHTHPVPLFGYILEGELTVDYGAKGQRTYLKGDGRVEAMNEAHNGRNTGPHPVKILAVFIGMEGVQGTAPALPPAH